MEALAAVRSAVARKESKTSMGRTFAIVIAALAAVIASAEVRAEEASVPPLGGRTCGPFLS